MKKISVIIPAYNNDKELDLTLNSIACQDFDLQDIEVLVCDDGSEKDMKAVAAKYAKQFTVRYFWHEDLGFRLSAARNMGLRNADGEMCVFIDSGVLVTSGCLAEHYRLYKEYGEKLCVVGYALGNDLNSDLNEMREIIDTHTPDDAAKIMKERNMIDGRERTYQGMGDDLSAWPAPYTALWGLHLAVPLKFMRDNNIWFDENFTAWGCEDADFGVQVFKAGAKFVLARKAVVIHYPPEVRSYDKLQNDPAFRAGWLKNKEYLKNKFPDDKSVRLFAEKGSWVANHPEQEE